MKLTLHRFELPLKHPFTISRGTVSVQPTLVVELEQDGQRGYGEATTNEYYGVSWESLRRSLESVRAAVEQSPGEDPAGLWSRCAAPLARDPFAASALDAAAHDLWGKLRGQPVYRLWGLTLRDLPGSCFTIGIDTLPMMVAKLSEMPGWPIYKIKLGTPDDLAIVRELRRHTEATFRVDANCGWSVEQTLRHAPELRALGVEFVEQPLPADDWQGAHRLHTDSPLPIMADESCQSESDVARCAGHFHAINIKLCKCGGLTAARRMIAEAHQLGLGVMVGCMTESTVGISAIAHLLPLLDYVDMDGAALLAQDIASGVRVERGVCHFPDRPGLGIELLDAALPQPPDTV